MKKSTQLRNLLYNGNTEFIMEAHNGLSAKIVEEAGFKGIWASGLAISASFGVRDNNEASWTQVLEVVEFMSDATNIPILLDGDTGYGNFNNARRLVKKLEQIDIAGVCIEDKIFPKTNSFISGSKQPLADIEEFCGKIAAMKDSQEDTDFNVIARLESFITGWGLDSALERANKYCEAGVDAILVHSKISKSDEIESFMKFWDNKCPIVIVPTKYYTTPTSLFKSLNISLVIWANHLIRSAIRAMETTAEEIIKEESIAQIEEKVVPVAEIFRLQNSDELKTAEEKYLPKNISFSAIILAATRGPEMGRKTIDKPKAMIGLSNKPLLKHIQETLLASKIKDITVVAGYKEETIKIDNCNKIVNKDWSKTGNVYSLYKAIDKIKENVIISYGDILYEPVIINELINSPGDIVLLVDSQQTNDENNNPYSIHVEGRMPPSYKYGEKSWTLIKKLSLINNGFNSHGRWIGLMKLSNEGSKIFKNQINKFIELHGNKSMLDDFINYLISNDYEVLAHYYTGKWIDIDNEKDLLKARVILKSLDNS